MRFKIEPSKNKPGYWVCSDFENKIVCIFENANFNDNQTFEYLDDETKIDANQLARVVNEMEKWLREFHYCKIFPCDIRLRIGQQIKSFRLQKGWSIRDLSEKAGIHHGNISAIENGKYNIRLDTIEKIEEAFDMKLKFERSDTGE